jgi:mono/diheme cytochrome c family protein
MASFVLQERGMKAVLALAILMAPIMGAAQSRDLPYQEVETIVLPKGDAQAGRQAFQDLKCHLCHSVTGERQFPAPIAELKGPVLNAMLQLQTSADVASAIIAPSHSLSVRTSEAVKAQMWRQGMSPMGDFSRVLTVRQLADLLAYLRRSR